MSLAVSVFIVYSFLYKWCFREEFFLLMQIMVSSALRSMFDFFSWQMCDQISNGKKCNYTGKCTFAHSQEEKEMWMYMKNNDRELFKQCLLKVFSTD